MADIFMSYTRADAERVGPLAAALEERGFSVFWDTEVLPGQLWRDVIHDELVEASCVIVVWSEGSIRSRWVGEEASEALEAGKLLPVLLDGTLPPFGFRAVEAANLSEWTPGTTNPEFENLVNAVTRIVAAAAPAVDIGTAPVESSDDDVGEPAPSPEAAPPIDREVEDLAEELDSAATTPPVEAATMPPLDESAPPPADVVDTPPEVEAVAATTSPESVEAVPMSPPDEVAPPAVPRDVLEASLPEDMVEPSLPESVEPPLPDEVAEPQPPAARAPSPDSTAPAIPDAPPPTLEPSPPDRSEVAPPEGVMARLGTGGIVGVGVAVVLVVIIGIVIASGGADGDPPATTIAGGIDIADDVADDQVTVAPDDAVVTQVVERDTVTAFRAAAPPSIDGNLGDWEGVPEAYRLQTEVFLAPDVVNRLGDDSPGVVLVRYDDTALYMAVVSSDDIYSQQNTGNQIFRGDALDINLTTASPGGISERPDGDDFQLTMTPRAADGQPSIVWFTGNGVEFDDNTTELPVVVAGAFDGSGAWQLEAAIPWSVFGLPGPPSGDLAALVAVFDNDGEVVDGRPQQTVILGHTSAEFQRPLTWGTLTFER